MKQNDTKLRTHKDLKKFLKREDILCSIDSDGYLCVDIEDSVYFDGVTMLPPKLKFYNEDDLRFDSLETLPRFCEFHNFGSGNLVFCKLIKFPSETIFENSGDVEFMILDTIPGGMVFNNGGDVSFKKNIISFGNGVIFSNRGDVNMKNIPVLNKFISLRNEGSVFIDMVDRIAHNYHFNNGGDVGIGIGSMGEAVVFLNEGHVEIGCLKILPKRTKFYSATVELLDVTEIKSRCAFKCCEILRMPSFKGFPKGIQFDVEESIYLDHIDFFARDVKFEYFKEGYNRYIVTLSGGGFSDGVAVTANSLSESVKSRIKVCFYDWDLEDDEMEDGKKDFDEYINGRSITEDLCLGYINDTEWAYFWFIDIPKKFLTRNVWLKGIEKSVDMVVDGLPQKYVNDMEFLKTIARNLDDIDVLHDFHIQYKNRVIELYSCVKPSLLADFYKMFPVKNPTQEFWMQLVSCCGEALEVVPAQFKRDEVINYVVMNSLETSLPFIPVDLLTQEIIFSAVGLNGMLLKYIPEDLIDEKCCDIAIDNNPLALEFVPARLKSIKLVERAINLNGLSYKFKPSDMIISSGAAINAKYPNLELLTWDELYELYLDYTNKNIYVSDIITKYNLDLPNGKLFNLFPEIIKTTDVCYNCSNNIYVQAVTQSTPLWSREYTCPDCGPFTYIIYKSGTKAWSKDMAL